MDKIIGNYLSQSNMDFPLDCETFNYIAQHEAMLAALGNIGGDKVILSGCQYTLGTRSEGYVFLRTKAYPDGEVLHFTGGTGDNLHIVTENIEVTADGYTYPSAYTKRYLAPGLESENYKWSDFNNFKSCRQLTAKLAQLQAQLDSVVSEPLGIIKIFAGSVVPKGYLLCDGKEINRDEYKELYSVIGDAYNEAPNYLGITNPHVLEGCFRLPDLRGRFVVGQNSLDTEYQVKGNAGGEKKHLLTSKETAVAVHNHDAKFPEGGDGEHRHLIKTDGGNDKGSGSYEIGNSDQKVYTEKDGKHSHKITIIESKGRDAEFAHENRPPYYTLAYIIKAK